MACLRPCKYRSYSASLRLSFVWCTPTHRAGPNRNRIGCYDAGVFEMDGATGQLLARALLNYETRNKTKAE